MLVKAALPEVLFLLKIKVRVLVLKLLHLLQLLFDKVQVFFALGVKRFVVEVEVKLGNEFVKLLCLWCKIGLLKVFGNVLYGLWGRVSEVVCVEAIVAEVIEQEFVGGIVFYFGVFFCELVCKQLQGGFAELIGVQAVFQVANGTDGKYDVQVGVVAK